MNRDAMVWAECWQVGHLIPARLVIRKPNVHHLITMWRERQDGSEKPSYTSAVSGNVKEHLSRHMQSFLHIEHPKTKKPPTHQSKSSAYSSYSPILPYQHASPSSSSLPYRSALRALFLFRHTLAAARSPVALASCPSRPA